MSLAGIEPRLLGPLARKPSHYSNSIHAAEAILRSYKSLNYTRTFQSFMEPSQEHTTTPYPEPDESSPYHLNLFFKDLFQYYQPT
jgi:hypothetical protein